MSRRFGFRRDRSTEITILFSKVKDDKKIERQSLKIRFTRRGSLNPEFGVDGACPSKYDCCKCLHLKIRGAIFWMFPRQPPARCSLYGVEKSIYRLPRSLLVVVPRSSRGESILRRDVEKRDVDVPRDRENDSGRENERTKEKGESEGKDERVVGYASVRICRVCACVCVCVCVCVCITKGTGAYTI